MNPTLGVFYRWGARDTKSRANPGSITAFALSLATSSANIFIHGVSRILAETSYFANAQVPMFQKWDFSAPVRTVLDFAWREIAV
jgi:hypothetical protein